MNTEVKERDLEVETGKSFAPEFISNLADIAGNTLHKWLEENGCPVQVIDLLEDVIILERDAIFLENKTITDWDARGLAQEIGNITERIAQLRGVFQDEYSVSVPRQKAITWQPAKHKDE